MYVDFNLLPDHARVWIYQASRKFSSDEEKIIGESARSFCIQWAAHGSPLKTSYKIEHQQFLIFSVDEGFNGASGCSIDGSVNMLKSLQIQLDIDFLDHSKVAFLINEGVRLISVAELKNSFATGTLGPDTLSFNVQAAQKGIWEKNWLMRAEDTWLARYLPKTPVS